MITRHALIQMLDLNSGSMHSTALVLAATVRPDLLKDKSQPKLVIKKASQC